MSIAVPDRCILAESNQLIEYSSPSNSQSEALKQKANALGLSVMPEEVGHASHVIIAHHGVIT